MGQAVPLQTSICRTWDKDPLVPVTFTVQRQRGYTLHEAVTVKVEFALPPEGTEMLVGLRCGVSPLGPDTTVAVKATVPEKPLTLVAVTMMLLHHPGAM